MKEESYRIIEKIAEEHSKKVFGYLDRDDLRNEIWIICLEKIKDYNPDRGELEHFLRVIVKNRLINRFKDITKSVRSPCPRCIYFDASGENHGCFKFGEDKDKCNKWRSYQLSIQSRNSLLNAAESPKEREINDNILNRIIGHELKQTILDSIDEKYKRDFKELISGSKISKQKIKRLKRIILDIIKDKKLTDYMN